jgi:hypothetical protein
LPSPRGQRGEGKGEGRSAWYRTSVTTRGQDIGYR